MDERLTKYQNTVLVISNALMKTTNQLSEKLSVDLGLSGIQKENFRVGIIEPLYCFSGVASSNEENPYISKEELDLFYELPIFYHAQLFSNFINRYNKEFLNKNAIVNQTRRSILLRDLLMNGVENYRDVTKRIPSPLEIIYIYCNELNSMDNRNKDKKIYKNLMSDKDLQTSVLLDFFKQFQEYYGSELKKGVLTVD